MRDAGGGARRDRAARAVVVSRIFRKLDGSIVSGALFLSITHILADA
jgi:hypothetical protein